MGSVSVVTTVKWFWFLLSLAALAGVIVALARSFKEASIQRYPEVNPVIIHKIIKARLARTHVFGKAWQCHEELWQCLHILHD
jgi:hypothetical protein